MSTKPQDLTYTVPKFPNSPRSHLRELFINIEAEDLAGARVVAVRAKAEVDRLRAENLRLRVALSRIAYKAICTSRDKMADIARAALKDCA